MKKENVLEIESQELFGDIAVRIKYVNIERFKKMNQKKKMVTHDIKMMN